ncbi:TonB-dependent receptor [Chondrinema litorale]|uniref:TonB-dependent receptor n=1 Tax=Chondrinema litorale TaxID=2994555 RepID=UPI002542D3E9|nr:TonB-dependent receptor [Chondrinema litorale]UZR96363.1 TonB-dependent receptor [Chondrinema litorale]
MQSYKKLILFLFFSAFIGEVYAQVVISGSVTSGKGEPLYGATVLIKGSQLGTVTDFNGDFTISKVPVGKQQLEVRYLGFENKIISIELKKNEPIELQIQLSLSGQALDEIVVEGKSISESKKSGSIKVQVIETEKFKLQSASVVELINRSPGIRIRQSGGLGSNTQINLNGFQGNSIRVFKDGIPMDYLGTAFSIGLVPTNTLERVEVYKGVLPADLGSDALGGALNLVSTNKNVNNISASYEIASFNTHRATLNANLSSKNNKLFGGVEAFYNYSDNNYNVNVNYVDEETRNEIPIKTKLFHNTFRQHYVEAFIGFRNRTWADELKFSVTNFKIYRENQFGQLMQYPLGAAYNTQTADFIPTIRYKKRLFSNKLYVDQFLAYSKITRVAVDTLNGRYDWLGNFIANENNQEPGEAGSANLTTLDMYNTTSRTTAVLSLSESNTITFNTVFNKYSQEGDDPYGDETEGENPVPLISLPANYNKLVSGLALDSDLKDGKIENSFQVKYYYSNSSGLSYDVSTGLVSDEEESASISTFGLGNSIRYRLNNRSFVRLSAEQATRLPTQREIFGDGDNVLANFGLKPERSTNLNLSLHHQDSSNLMLDLNFFYRYTKDMISTRLSEEVFYSIAENLNKVRGYGLETEIRYQFLKRYAFRGNMTYQSFRQKGHQDGETALYDDARVSNMPYFFANLGLEADFNGIFAKNDALKAYWNYSYVHPYFLKRIPKKLEPEGFLQLWGEPGLETSLYIEKQHIHSAGIVWIPNQSKKFSTGIEVKNIFDTPVYDNFKIQNAGRSFHFKLTYLLNFSNI